MRVEFFVPGHPVSKGSMRNVGRTRTGAAILRANNAAKLEPWCAMVGLAARAACRKAGLTAPLADAAFRVGVTYRFPRPKSHTCKRGLRTGAPRDHIQKPDVDKLDRAILDALTGIVWADDCQVIGHLPGDGKRWCMTGEEPGALVQIEIIEREAA